MNRAPDTPAGHPLPEAPIPEHSLPATSASASASDQDAGPDSQPESPPTVASTLPFSFSSANGIGSIDTIEGHPLPIVRVFGWCSGRSAPVMALAASHHPDLMPAVVSRLRRPDVVAAGESQDGYCGFRADFLLDHDEQPLALQIDGQPVYRFAETPRYSTIDPHYKAFFTQDRVMGRDSVYGSGPPTDVTGEFKEFLQRVSGEVLDFGCGNGDVVALLLATGVAVTGLELDEPRIHGALKPEAAPHVKLYPGGVPLPFADACFDWIVSTEVIEHVPRIADYVPEFARLLRPGGKLLITTPDITSIPSSFPAQCVPWHLLESTHIHFFTPQSVTRLFAAGFDLDATYCLGATRINGYFVPGSVGAIFTRR